MKRKTLIIITSGFLLLIVLVAYVWITSTNPKAENIATSTTAATITANYQRKTFYANDNHWIFYSNGSHILYTNSKDGINWKPSTVLREGASSSGISIWLDQNLNVHYAYASGITDTPVVYRKGLIINDEIQWQPEQQVTAGSAEHAWYNGFCTVDSSGYPWVSYIEDYQGAHSSYAVKATSKDGTSWGNPTRIAEPISTATFPRTSLFPLNNDEIYAIYATATGVNGRLWNGNNWENEETISTTSLQQDFGYSAVSDDNNVHLALLEAQTYNILYFERTPEGWSAAATIQKNQDSSSLPILTVDQTTHKLYCFWTYNNVIYMEESIDAIPSTPFGNSFGSIRTISSYYNVGDGKIGFAWVERPDPQVETFILKYRFLEIS